MTTLTTSATSTRSTLFVGLATAIVASVLSTLFAHDWREVLVVVPVIIVAAGVIFGLVVPRALGRDDASGTALGLAIPAALLLLPAFWSGLPLVLGVAAMTVGNAGRSARSGAAKATVALVVAALVVVAYAAIYVSEGIAGSTGFLLG